MKSTLMLKSYRWNIKKINLKILLGHQQGSKESFNCCQLQNLFHASRMVDLQLAQMIRASAFRGHLDQDDLHASTRTDSLQTKACMLY